MNEHIYNRIEDLIKSENFSEILKLINETHHILPRNYVLLVEAICFYKKNDFVRSSNNLIQVPDEKKNYYDFYIQANSFFHLGEYEKSISYFLKSISLNNKFYKPYLHLCISFFNIQKYQEALYYSELFISLDDTNPDAYLFAGKSLYKLAKYKEALPLLQKVTHITTKMPDSYLFAGKAFYQLGNYKKAIPLLNKAISLDNTNSDAYLFAGKSLYKLGKYEEALPLLEKSISLDNTNYESYLLVGNSFYNLKNFEKAVSFLKIAHELNPDHGYTSYIYAFSFMKQNKFLECIEILDKLIQVNKLIPEVYYFKAMCYFSLEDYANAEDNFSKCYILQSKHQNISLYYMGMCALKMHDYNKAIIHFKNYHMINPHNVKALDYIFESVIKTSTQLITLKNCNDAISKNKGGYAPFYLKGLILLENYQFSEANDAFQTSITLKPDLYQANFYISKCLFFEGKLNESYQLISKVIDFKPDFSEAIEFRNNYISKFMNFKSDLCLKILSGTIIAEPNIIINSEEDLQKFIKNKIEEQILFVKEFAKFQAYQSGNLDLEYSDCIIQEEIKELAGTTMDTE